MSAKADIVNEIFRIECIPELGVLSVSDYFANGDLPLASLDKNAEILAEKYGIYDHVPNIIAIDTETHTQSSKTFEKICRLPVEDDISSDHFENFYIKLVGDFYNQNYMGYCGLWTTFILTISTDKQTIIEELPFVNMTDDCSAPGEIKSITLYPHQGYITVRGEKIDSKTRRIKDAPFHRSDFYPPPPPPCTDRESENMETGECEKK